MIEIRRYESKQQAEWNVLVASSRNGTFIHDRRYMDYHSDRFDDHSLFVFRLGKPVAVFAASESKKEIVCHGGLTYGGLLSTESLGAAETLEAFPMIGDYYKRCGFEKIVYKAVPYIFHRFPCQEDLYALFRVGAQLFRRDASSVISMTHPFSFSKGRKWSINKARKLGIKVRKSLDYSSFHALLEEVLRRFNTKPTHTKAELELLAGRFPENIHLYEAELGGQILAGTVIFDFGETVHTQYLATSERGREIGALDFLIAELINEVYSSKRYFSFGVSTEEQGQYLNAGLIAQKEGFGARTITHDFYEWKL